MSFRILLALCFLLPVCLLAQEPYARIYGIEDGLPSLETYQLRVDSRGEVWIATDRGIARFDGSGFTTYSQKDGLEDLTVIAMTEDNHGRMWASTWSNRLYYFEDGRFHAFSGNESIIEDQSNARGRVFAQIRVIDDTVWISGRGMKTSWVDVHGNNNFADLTAPDFQLHMTQHRGFSISGQTRSRRTTKQRYFYLIHGTDTTFYPCPTVEEVPFIETRIGARHLPNGDFFLHWDRMLLVIKPDGEVTRLPGEFVPSAHAIHADRNGLVWVGSIRNGVTVFDSKNNYEFVGNYYKDRSITFIDEDQEGGIWMTTIEKGVYYLPSPDILLVRETEQGAEQKFVHMLSCWDSLYCGNYQGDIYRLDHPETRAWKLSPVMPEKHWSEVRHMICFKDTVWVEGNTDHEDDPTTHPFKSMNIPDSSISLSDMLHLNLYNFMSRLQVYGGISVSDSIFGLRVLSSLRDQQDRWWFATIEGLQVLENNKLRGFAPGNPALNSRINDLHLGSSLFATTFGYGVEIIDPVSLTTRRISTEHGLPNNNCTAVLEDSRNQLWVGSVAGISVFRFDEWGKPELVKHYQSTDGLPGTEVIELIEYHNKIWAIYRDAFVGIPMDREHRNPIPPKIELATPKLMVEDSLIDLKSDQLSYRQNNLEFRFRAQSFKNALNIPYSFRLLGQDSTFRTTHERQVRFAQLQPGDYTFEVKAANNDGVYSSTPARWSFTIRKPWYGTWTFRICALLVLIGGIVAIFRFRERIRTERTSLQLAVLENEQKALTAQINPHFMYNAINSVQYFVLEKEPRKASDILAKFSELMRKVLTNTRSNFIPLQSELDILQLYLDLEKERFEEKFSYEFQVPENLDTENLKIPSLVVQPHVENAIWHGLLNKKSGDRHLIIAIEDEGDTLVWRVRDNGIGRKHSKSLKGASLKRSEGFTSSGIALTQGRLDLLAKRSGKPYKLEIRDLENPTGTEVIITIPKV